VQHTSDINVDGKEACESAIAFVRQLHDQIDRRMDPFLLEQSAHPYLVATLLHPHFKKFTFMQDSELYIETAKGYLLQDMEEVQEQDFQTGWVQKEVKVCEPQEEQEKHDDEKKDESVVGGKRKATIFDCLDGDDNDDDGPVPVRARPSNALVVDMYLAHVWTNASTKVYKSQSPVQLWQELVEQNVDYTLLARVALRYLHTPASSAPTERVWSVGTNTLVKNRRSMTGPSTSKLIMLGSNKHLVKL